jgi:hypothetical protein
MTEPIRFSDSITIRCQPEITALVDRAARAKGSKPSEWARQALLAGLRSDGFDPAAAGIANPVVTWIVAEAMDRIGGEVETPRSWPKEHKWRFTQLPCILRRYLAGHERQREKTVRQAQNELAMARQQLAAIQKPAEITDGNSQIAAA